MNENKLNWECTNLNQTEDSVSTMERAKVFGGWVLRSFSAVDQSLSTALCFIPDANHEWEL